MAAKTKQEPKPSKKAPNMMLLLSAVLLVGIIIGVGAKLAYDFLAGQKNNPGRESQTVPKGQEEVTSEDTNSLPTNFPKDFPLYPDSSLKTSWTTQGELKEGISVLWESGDASQAVADYYKQKLPELGWSVNSSFDSEGSYTISFEKETIDGFIGITLGEGGLTQISVTLGIEIISI